MTMSIFAMLLLLGLRLPSNEMGRKRKLMRRM
jgi:hypothetical protein